MLSKRQEFEGTAQALRLVQLVNNNEITPLMLMETEQALF